MSTLLEIENLTVQFNTAKGLLTALSDVSLHIRAGETVCLVGESGSGKTITSKSIMRLIDFENGIVSGGTVKLDGDELTAMSGRELQNLRGKKMAMIFQEPMAAFDPVFTIGSQIIEVIVRHKLGSRKQAWARGVELLRRAGIPEPEARMKQYPGELSGGMLQRAMIAMALACGPELLIADEPTTALDMTVQAQILQLLKELQQEFNMAILLITHDMGIAAEMADRIIVMYAGKVVEQATASQLFGQPHHPYTKGLLQSITTLDSIRKSRLPSIEGTIPGLAELPEGCRFHPRCPHATAKCVQESPPLLKVNGRQAACWYAGELAGKLGDGQAVVQTNGQSASRPCSPADIVHLEPEPGYSIPSPFIDIIEVKKYYPLGRSIFAKHTSSIRAVDDVSLQIRRGETFGLVGESGSGKSTLGRMILQLEQATGGDIRFEGRSLTGLSEGELQKTRRNMQMIFQDPYGSMNPRWKVSDIIGEPLRVHEAMNASEKRIRIEALLESVGLNPKWADRYPHEFSGGQRQRIGIARAIALRPSFILADEAVSALDVSVQAQIINLMQELQQELGLTYLFIGHGLHVVRHVSDRIGVMYLGKLVEIADSEELFANPAHHYTRGLIASIPWPDPGRERIAAGIAGEIPSPSKPPSGCRFHTRCPAVTARCREEEPKLAQVRNSHWAACHFPA